MLEIESMGPMAKLAPGASVKHTEQWDLYGDVPAFTNEAEIEKNITGRGSWASRSSRRLSEKQLSPVPEGRATIAQD